MIHTEMISKVPEFGKFGGIPAGTGVLTNAVGPGTMGARVAVKAKGILMGGYGPKAATMVDVTTWGKYK